jgi:hypothetical protein
MIAPFISVSSVVERALVSYQGLLLVLMYGSWSTDYMIQVEVEGDGLLGHFAVVECMVYLLGQQYNTVRRITEGGILVAFIEDVCNIYNFALQKVGFIIMIHF